MSTEKPLTMKQIRSLIWERCASLVLAMPDTGEVVEDIIDLDLVEAGLTTAEMGALRDKVRTACIEVASAMERRVTDMGEGKVR